MKTLFIERIYLNGYGGGANCSRAFINALAELSEEFTLVYPMKTGKEPEYLSAKITSLVPSINNFSKFKKGLMTLFGKLNFLQKLPSEFFDEGKFDLVVFSGTQASQGLIKRYRKMGIKIITLHHNYEYEFVKDNSSRIFKTSQLLAIRMAEKTAVKESNLNLCLTLDDICLLKNNYDSKAKYALAGTFEFQVQEDKMPIAHKKSIKTFIITGDLSFKQSNDSIIPWIKNYYSILKEVCPNCNLIIAGRNPSQDLYHICDSNGIELVPSPSNMDEILIKADYYICPISKGGGLKLRCMDGLKWGLPVIAHKVSSRGYEVMIDKKVFKCYDSPETFKNSLIELLDLNLTSKDVMDAYKSYFSYSNGKQRLKEILIKNNILS